MFTRRLASLSLCPLVAERLLSGSQAPTALHAAFPWLTSSSTSSTSFLTGYASLSNGVNLAQQRMLSSSPASSSSTQAQAAAKLSEDIFVDESAVLRLRELRTKGNNKDVFLRIEVEGGGCSGFQYKFSLDTTRKADDRVFEKDGSTVICDEVSYSFLKGAKVEFEDNLMRSAFTVSSNPNSEASCGCGTSFAAKMS